MTPFRRRRYSRGRCMSTRWLAVAAVSSVVMLGGCGLFVPEVRDFPNGRSYANNNELVQAIVRSIHCELKDAVTNVINAKSNRYAYGTFLRNWGAEVGLTIQMEEKSTASPTALWAPVSPVTSVFTLSGGFTGSSDATRVDKVNYYYKVSELYQGPNGKCQRDDNPPPGSLLI